MKNGPEQSSSTAEKSLHYEKVGHIASRKQQSNSLCLAVNPPPFDKGGKNVVRS